jgi:tetratricopeptide (TPR) repeat protein
MTRGRTFSKQGDFLSALGCYQKIVETDPTNASAHFYSGACLAALGYHEEAIESYLLTISYDDDMDCVRAHHNVGISLTTLGRHEEALGHYNRAIELDPDKINAYVGKGVSLAKLGRHDEAISLYNFVIDNDFNAMTAYVNKGISLSELNQHSAAIECFDEAIRIKPDNVLAFVNKGGSLAETGRHQEASECFATALRIDPFNASAYVNKGGSLLELGQHYEAILLFDAAIAMDPQNYNAYFNKGLCYATLHQYSEAIACYQKAIEVDPDVAGTHYNMGLSYALSGNLLLALEYYENAVRLDPGYADTYFNIGHVLTMLGRESEAQSFFHKTLEVDSNNLNAKFWLSRDGVAFENANMDTTQVEIFNIDPDAEPVRKNDSKYWIRVVSRRTTDDSTKPDRRDFELYLDEQESEKTGCNVFTFDANHETVLAEKEMLKGNTSMDGVLIKPKLNLFDVETSQSERLDMLYERAVEYKLKGMRLLAALNARAAVDIDPTDPRAPFLQRVINPCVEIPYSRLDTRGGFGRATKVWPDMVVKVIFSDSGITFLNEVNSLILAQCDHVIKYYGHYITKEDETKLWQFILMEKVECTLADVLQANELHDVPKLEYNMVHAIMKGLLQALNHIHSQQMVHCDVKPSNIGLLGNGTASDMIKMLDFGGTVPIGKKSRAYTKWYACTEYRDQPASPVFDIFSAGRVLQECLLHINVHNELKMVAEKACCDDPKNRYQTATEMLADFEQVWEKVQECGEEYCSNGSGIMLKSTPYDTFSNPASSNAGSWTT